MAAEQDPDVFQAQMAEQAERYEEMVEFMKTVVTKCAADKRPMGVEQRNLLSVAYKNVVGARRAAYRILTSLADQEGAKEGHAVELDICNSYKDKIATELESVCNDVLGLLEEKLIPNAQEEEKRLESDTTTDNSEATVFYLKMAGDYHRYIAEFAVGDKKESATKSAVDMYQCASDAANAKLPPTHPIRLGLALNFSVFFFEICGKSEQACELAKKAFDDAIAELDTLSEDSYKDATLIMQLLRDNLTLWTQDEAGNEGGDQ